MGRPLPRGARLVTPALALVLAGGVTTALARPGEPAGGRAAPAPVTPGATSAPTRAAAPAPPATGAPVAAPPTPTTGPASALAVGFTPQPLHWKPCADGFQCSTLTVPVDYAKPRGATVGIAVTRLPAGGSRTGSLLVNPGGPGGSGVQWLQTGGAQVFTDVVRRHFDLVSFDPRGVGGSHPVRCESGTQLDAYFHDDPAPTSVAGRDRYAADTRAFDAGCTRRTGSFLAHVGTVEVATDMDSLRRALGEATISYFGYSYGTYLGTTWLSMFPRTVRAAVLDGAVDPTLDLPAFAQGQAVAFDAELERFFTWCDAHGSLCTFHVRGQSAAQRYDALAARVATTPLPAAGARTVGPGELSYGVGYAMYSTALWPGLGRALTTAEGGDGGGLLAYSDAYLDRGADGSYANSDEANAAVSCLDHEGPRTEAAWFAAGQAVTAQAPRLGRAIVYDSLPCAFWPEPARAPVAVGGRGAPAVIVIGGTHDPATPYAWAQHLAALLPTGRLLTRDGDGHTSYGAGEPCVQQAVDAYLLSLDAPARGARC